MLLNIHSYYSLRYGTLSLEQLACALLDNGYDTAVLTDINNSSATLDFVRICWQHELNGLAGMEFRNGDELLYIGIAKNEKGFRELNELMTAANRDNSLLPAEAPAFDNVFIIYPYGKVRVPALKENEYIGVPDTQLNRIAIEPPAWQEKYVMLYPVTFGPKQYELHRQLRAIDHNILISQLQPEHTCKATEAFIPKDELLKRYDRFPRLITNTQRLLSACSFSFDYASVKNKKHFTGNEDTDRQLLFQYTMEGFAERYDKYDHIAAARVQKELDIIDRMHFSSYFLMTDDICRYARLRGFHYVGRGSGANSVVAYCLRITDVDPVALNLYFERFLNPKRKVSPDFDIDFSWNQRDEIYEYIFQRYGAANTALMGTMSNFRSRSIIRELGKVYGLPKAEIDRLVHEPENMLNKNEVTRMILSVYEQMGDFPNQRSIHASGVLISELPITSYCALDYPPKGLPVAQIDMYTAEELTFEKFDILSQRGIGHIRDCREIVRQNRGEVIHTDNPKRFFDDPEIAAQLRSANSIGCFYIESPAMRQLLTKLQCADYLTLVAASSIIRPGVASSGMMKAFIERHRDPLIVRYPHPVFEEHLKDTYGIMVYQEDVMKIGHYYGGLDLADADVLRRIMSGNTRYPDLLKNIEQKFFSNCAEKGYPEKVSREIWQQMESFAGFSFNKAHSASFAVESFQSLYLKTYYPLEFMVAVLNNYGGFYQRKVYVNEARKAGGNICLPCVNKSLFNTTIEGKDIYLGFDCLQNLESSLAKRIPAERLANGLYTGLEDLILRTGASLEQCIVLIRCGALRFTGTGKKELLWEVHLLLSQVKKIPVTRPLFENCSLKPVLPKLETSLLEDIYDEIELIGFPVSASMFDLARSDYRGDAFVHDLRRLEGRTIRMVGDFIADKTVRTKSRAAMKFGTFLDVHGDFFDTVHFSPVIRRYPLSGNGLYLIQGRVVMDFGCPSIEVEKCAKVPLKADPRSV